MISTVVLVIVGILQIVFAFWLVIAADERHDVKLKFFAVGLATGACVLLVTVSITVFGGIHL